jgi:DNA-binding NtrC family response regulator
VDAQGRQEQGDYQRAHDQADGTEGREAADQLDGHITRFVGSAEEAFPNALEDEPDVVVTDYRLPGINGAMFVKEFLCTHTRARAMVISAYTDTTTIAAAMNAGATFMGKPLDLKLLGRWVGEGSA